MANDSTLRNTYNSASSSKCYYITALDNDFGIDADAAFEGMFFFAQVRDGSSALGPIYAVDISHDGSSGVINVFADTTNLNAPGADLSVALVGAWFSNALAAGVTFYDGATPLPTLDLAANQGLFLPLELS